MTKGKQDLFDAILEIRGAEFLERVADDTAGVDEPLGLLRCSIRSYVRFFAAHRSFLMLNLREPRAWAVGPLPEVEGWRRTRSQLTALLRRGIESGAFYPGDPERAAQMATAILQVQMLALLEQIPDDADEGDEGDDALEPLADAVAAEILLQLERLLCPPATPELQPRRIA